MDQLLDEANNSARHIVQSWIRKVFRETAIQVLRTSLCVLDRNECEIHVMVTNEKLELCDRGCRRLAELWKMKLVLANQNEIAGWVEEVSEKGGFWEEDEYFLQTDNRDSSKCEFDVEQVEGDRILPNSYEEILLESSLKRDPALSITKLRRVAKEGDIMKSVKELDEIGHRGDTMWPYDWILIEDAAKEIPQRLHLDEGNKKTKKVEYEIVPKSILKNRQGNDNKHDVNISKVVSRTSGNVAFHLERKKRKAQEVQEDRVSQCPRREEPTEQRRTPSQMEPHHVWDWELIKTTIEDQQGLEIMYIHPDPKPKSNQILLGAMKHLGQCHLFLQNEWDDELSNSMWKGALRRAVKERIGGVQLIRDERDMKKLQTKLRRAYIEKDNQVRFEFDLGECMMEVENRGIKRLCAFSSVELSLTDEDK